MIFKIKLDDFFDRFQVGTLLLSHLNKLLDITITGHRCPVTHHVKQKICQYGNRGDKDETDAKATDNYL